MSPFTTVEDVDLIVLSRDRRPLPPAVRRGLEGQQGVRVHMHPVIGAPRPADTCRWDAIVRARNRGKRLGHTRWLMFVDDDVALDAHCMAELVRHLYRQPAYGALAANYLGEGSAGVATQHVGMGATLFRREALDRISFRWEPCKCECQCCCDDLRRRSIGISYCAAARARHLKTAGPGRHPQEQHPPAEDKGESRCENAGRATPPGRVLTALNRRHFELFRRQFLTSLRRAGNDEQVTVVGYGLLDSQRRALARMERVDLLAMPFNPTPIPRQRLRGFQRAMERFDPATPVAYWDAGDVIFQGRLTALWEIVRSHPNRLLVVREPVVSAVSRTVAHWTLSIADPVARRRAFQLLSSHPFFNGGFAAGTVRTLLDYLRHADRLRESAALRGSANGGDQTAMNLYCHSNRGVYREIDDAWNYCLCHREQGDFRTDDRGRVAKRGGARIHVVHGNGKNLHRIADRRFPGQNR
jgi:hypothetical protein